MRHIPVVLSLAVALLLSVLFASWVGAYQPDKAGEGRPDENFYQPDHIDKERYENWKAMRSHDCFWRPETCNGYRRRWPSREYVYRGRKPIRYSNGDSDAHCHRFIEATGEQAQSKDNAENLALRNWQGRVRFHFGEKYISFENARDKKITCSPSSVADTVGGKIQDKLLGISHFRCELSARPCRAPARRIDGKED